MVSLVKNLRTQDKDLNFKSPDSLEDLEYLEDLVDLKGLKVGRVKEKEISLQFLDNRT